MLGRNPRPRQVSVVVIGLGRFGGAVAASLARRGIDVVGVDIQPGVVQRWAQQIEHVVQADATDDEALARLGVSEFDRAVGGGLVPGSAMLLAGAVNLSMLLVAATTLRGREGVDSIDGAHAAVSDTRVLGTAVAAVVATIATLGGLLFDYTPMGWRFTAALAGVLVVLMVMRITRRLNIATNFYSQFAIVFPLLVAAPRYFSGAIQMGGLMQIASAFGQVQGAHAGPLPAEHSADLGQARVVPGHHELGAGGRHLPGLLGPHRHRDVGVLHGEGAAEAAALLRPRQLAQVDAAHRPEQLQGAVADAQHAQ